MSVSGGTIGERQLSRVSDSSSAESIADAPGQELKFSIQGKPSFELPLSEVANSNIAGKNEVALEFNPPKPPAADSKDLSKRPPDDLVEIRFYVPGPSILPKGSDAGSDAEDEVEEDDEGNEISAAEAMHNKIKEKADIGTVLGKSICIFEDALILTPRYVYLISQIVSADEAEDDTRSTFTTTRYDLLENQQITEFHLLLSIESSSSPNSTIYMFSSCSVSTHPSVKELQDTPSLWLNGQRMRKLT
jgi:structure-specific recognition protein 1